MRRLIACLWLGLVLAVAVPGAARAEWFKAETEHFIVYGDVSENQIRRYATKIERFDGLLRAYYPIQTDHEIPKLEIYLADGLADMRQIWPSMTSSVGGFYSPNSPRIHAVVNLKADMGDQVMFHEYAHHFMFQMASAAYPSWFIEGFAEYYGLTEMREDKIRVGMYSPGRMHSLTIGANSWAPMRDVLSWRVYDSGRYRGADYYAQAWALAHYLYSDPTRTPLLGQYLNAVTAGGDPVTSLETIMGKNADQIQRDLRMYLTGAIPVFEPQIEIDAGEIVITRLPASARDLTWLDIALDRYEHQDTSSIEDEDDRKETQEHRDALIRRAFDMAKRWPGDRMAAMVEARAHRMSGDLEAARTALAPLIGEESTDAAALRLAGVILLEQAQAEEDHSAALVRSARSYLGRALAADPLDFRIYRALDDSRRGASNYPTANDVSTLMVAATLAPQSHHMRLRYAQALMTTGKNAEAIIILMPVANAPHASSMRAAAQEMIDKAREAQGLAPLEGGEGPPDEDGEPDDGTGEGQGSHR